MKIVHVDGKDNKVADCLSQYYENDGADDFHPIEEYVNADIRLNPELDELLEARREEVQRVVSLRAMELSPHRPRKVNPNNVAEWPIKWT